MKKSSLPKPITILILTLLTTVLWVGLNVYRTFTLKPSATVSENISRPLDPTLDTATIQQIQSAIYIPDSEIPQINAGGSKTSSPIATATPTPISTATPESSSSAVTTH